MRSSIRSTRASGLIDGGAIVEDCAKMLASPGVSGELLVVNGVQRPRSEGKSAD